MNLELYWFVCDYSLTELREQIHDINKESNRIDDIVNTAALILTGKNVPSKKTKESRKVKESDEKPEIEEEKEPEIEDQQIYLNKENNEQKDRRQIHNALFQSKIDSLVPKYNIEEETKLFSIRGMMNWGNTWFFNSAMQCLNATKDMYFMYHDNTNGCYGKGYAMCNQFRKFMDGMRSKNRTPLTPKNLLNGIFKKVPRFRGGAQQDSHELLINMLDVMDMEATKKQKRSIVDKCFGGYFCNSVWCLTCK